jgi:D-sedoheptulose 7-phosphate isomerase
MNEGTTSKLSETSLTAPPALRSETYVRNLTDVLASLPFDGIDEISEILVEAYDANRALFLFGNGGSAALASHSACDLGKGTVFNGNRRFRVLALTDNVPLMTAWANDSHYEEIFAEQLRPFAQPGDVAFAISGSGNSPNILKGLQAARSLGAKTIGLAGFQGGKMKGLCDRCVVVPSDNMQLIEDVHLSITHAIFVSVRERIKGSHGQFALAAAANARSSS